MKKIKTEYMVIGGKVYFEAERVVEIAEYHGDTKLAKQIKETIKKETRE